MSPGGNARPSPATADSAAAPAGLRRRTHRVVSQSGAHCDPACLLSFPPACLSASSAPKSLQRAADTMCSRQDTMKASLTFTSTTNITTPVAERPATLGSSRSMHALQLPKSNCCQTTPNSLPSKITSSDSFASSLNSSTSPCFPFGIELVEKHPENHNCLQVLQTFVQYQQQQIALLESNLRELALNSSRREENLVDQMCDLQQRGTLSRHMPEYSATVSQSCLSFRMCTNARTLLVVAQQIISDNRSRIKDHVFVIIVKIIWWGGLGVGGLSPPFPSLTKMKFWI